MYNWAYALCLAVFYLLFSLFLIVEFRILVITICRSLVVRQRFKAERDTNLIRLFQAYTFFHRHSGQRMRVTSNRRKLRNQAVETFQTLSLHHPKPAMSAFISPFRQTYRYLVKDYFTGYIINFIQTYYSNVKLMKVPLYSTPSLLAR